MTGRPSRQTAAGDAVQFGNDGRRICRKRAHGRSTSQNDLRSDETNCHFRARVPSRVSFTISVRSIDPNPGPDLFRVRCLLAGCRFGFLSPELFANPRTDRLVDVSGCCLVKFRPCLSCFSQLLYLRMGDLRRYRYRHLAAVAFQRVCRCAAHCFPFSPASSGISG